MYTQGIGSYYFEVSWVKRDPPPLPSGFTVYSFSDSCSAQGSWMRCSLEGPLQLSDPLSLSMLYMVAFPI